MNAAWRQAHTVPLIVLFIAFIGIAVLTFGRHEAAKNPAHVSSVEIGQSSE